MLNNLWSMNPVILFVLGTLVFFSLVSWSILVYKLIHLSTLEKLTKKFTGWLWGSEAPLSAGDGWKSYEKSPLATLYLAGRKEALDGSPVENVERTLHKVANREIEKLGKDVSFLATTASCTPFIGLFGTVWGIMNAFQGIGEAGSTSLAVVAPGISEALVTTAIGLAAAIPALIGYNFIQARTKGLVSEIDDFTSDFLNLVQKAHRG